MPITFTLLTEGTSDRSLIPIAQWLFERHLPKHVPVRGEFADLNRLRDRPKALPDRIRRAIDLYSCDVLLVHRDADGPDPVPRLDEIRDAHAESGVQPPLVCVVPVRETEAWLLFDEAAIRRAAGNPNGRVPLPIPSTSAEAISDPKRVLLDALRTASELSGRRRRRFNAPKARSILAHRIEDFAPLLGLNAFRRFEADVVQLIQQLDVAAPGE